MRVPCTVLLLVALLAGSASAAARKWTSADGKFTVQAELVTVKDDKVELRKADGTTLQVPLERLGAADRRYLSESCSPAEGDKATASTAAGSEGQATCSLQLKRLDLPQAGSRAGFDAYTRLCTPQTFYMEVGGRSNTSSDDAEAFRQIVKKEPSHYVAARPFRGVARLGGRPYAFVLDASSPSVPGYDRLYFDLNGNGDLTDDHVIAGSITPALRSSTTVFPRVDLPLDVHGSPQDFSFFFNVHCQSSAEFSYATASLTPAAYRDGRMVLAGKKRHVVLLDSNSNGLFSDPTRPPSMKGVPHITPGDTLLFDPELTAGPTRRGVGGIMEGKCYLAKVICVDGRFYDCQVSSLGDKLALKPSDVGLGYVTNPNPGFAAVIYSDSGDVMTIGGGKSKIALPEGSWRLVSYTMDQFALTKPAAGTKAKNKRSARSDQRGPAAPAPLVVGTARGVVLAAAATKESPAVHVGKDEVVSFPFGPPYKAVIITNKGGRGQSGTVRLSLLLTGAGGERCTSIMLASGALPTPPAFTITNSAGQVVQQGQFEFG